MAELDLNFIVRQLANILGEQRAGREEIRGVQVSLRSIRDEIGILRNEVGLLREEVRITSATVRRLDDTITMNVLDRLQSLEATLGTSNP